MAIYYVFQGKTYSEELKGHYVWSPQLDKSGRKNAGYTMMTNIRKGDFILHNANGKVVAISIAIGNCYKAEIPEELWSPQNTWAKNGYKVETEYFEFDEPIFIADEEHRKWLITHYIEGSAFTKSGKGKQQYMCHLADEHAVFLLNDNEEIGRASCRERV